MEKRFFPSIGQDISLLGFGLMRLPLVAGGAEIDYPLAEKMLDRALEAGVNYFDTAWPYHNGQSETVAGKALSRHKRDSYCLASKCPTWEISAPQDVERIFAEQLEKCRTDYFDFYLVHSLNTPNYEITRKMKIYETLLRKKETGQIRRLGFSFHDHVDLLERITSDYDWDFAQIQLNYIDWEVINSKRQYEILAARKIPAVIMEPLRGGALATLNSESADILRRFNPQASIASWALRFAASLPGVLTVLSGMSAPEQLEDNIKTMRGFTPIGEAEKAKLAVAAQIYKAAGAIPCTGCRYCMDCPSGVDIPRVFAVFNHYRIEVEKNPYAKLIFSNHYNSIGESARAHNCTDCGACMEQCPQHIQIPASMKIVEELAVEIAL
ncbi:MAG: aldo/keto reductase [Desulfovibrio sp.]|jgi:predicted aldo/keto reductase-like oxidoreductase|nr:aldo/keto reductase [Desulfovibrio sp.]